MRKAPDISVVMAVYNGSPTLRRTLDSVLSQKGVDLELIVVNDGSTDATPEVLETAASADGRLRVEHQENQGLTQSLVRGCELAQGRLVARQDGGGDLSLPGRLRAQAELFEQDGEAVLVSGGARFVSPDGEFLYDSVPQEGEVGSGLDRLSVDTVRGPAHHGATMFRRDVYMSAGGYRTEFSLAQDLDLWLRLVEFGTHRSIPAVVYQAVFSPESLSAVRRSRQIRTAHLILECARRRRRGLDERDLLEKAAAIAPPKPGGSNRLGRSSALYFMGSCLESRAPEAARRYYRRSLAEFPLNPKSWLRLLLLRR